MTPDRHKKGGERLKKGTGDKKPVRPKPQRTRKEVILRRCYIALTVISALVVVLFAAYKLMVVKPKLNVDTQKPPKGPVQTLAPGETEDPKTTRNPDRKSEDFYTILVAGRDTGGGGNTDVVMVVSYDVTNQKLSVMNIPRDTMVNKSWDIKKINSVYNYGGGKKGDGLEALKSTVADTIGFEPDFHVIVEWEAVGRLAKAIGGVDFDVPLNMSYDDPYQDLHIHINKGQQHLDGDQVMKVLRFRKNNNGTGYASGDIGRIETQQKLLKAIAAKLLSPATLTKLPELVDIFAENVETDLSIQNLLWFGEAALKGGLSMDNVSFVTMPGNYNGYFWSYTIGANESYVFPYIDELIELVNADFNPYKTDVTRADLDIMYKNKDGTIASTSGVVKDSKANSAWLAAKNAPKATPTPEPTDTPDPDASPAVSGSPAPGTSPSPRPSGAGGTGLPDRGTPPPDTSPDGGMDGPTEDDPVDTPPPEAVPTPDPEPTPDPNAPPAGIPIF